MRENYREIDRERIERKRLDLAKKRLRFIDEHS